MKGLIKALQIFLKYGTPSCPTHCEHDVLRVMIDPELVSPEDKQELGELGFFADHGEDLFKSFRYGSA